MVLTKKNFKEIARIIKDNLMTDYNINQSVITELSDYFYKLNPKFDKIKFSEAILK